MDCGGGLSMFGQRKRAYAVHLVRGASVAAAFAGASCTPNAPGTLTPNGPVAASPSVSAAPATPPQAPPTPQTPPPAEATDEVKQAYLATNVVDSPEYFKRIHVLYQRASRAKPLGKHHV